jgi:biopolymer transport protein ExbB/TolQ
MLTTMRLTIVTGKKLAQQQASRRVWNASYENMKEADEIVQHMQRLQQQQHLSSKHETDARQVQQELSKLRQDYKLVTGEEYEDDEIKVRPNNEGCISPSYGDK